MSHRKIILAWGMVLWFGGVVVHAASAANEGPPPVTALAMMASVIPCSDLERSIAFYTKGLGMSLAGRIENPSGTEAPLQFPGAGAYIILFKPRADTSAPTHGSLNRIVLAVPDIKVLEDKLIAAGYHLSAPIAQQPKYHVAVGLIQDPDGNHLELVQRLP